MLIDNDFYSKIIPDDGLISDFALEMRLHDTYLLEELLGSNSKHSLGCCRADLMYK